MSLMMLAAEGSFWWSPSCSARAIALYGISNHDTMRTQGVMMANGSHEQNYGR